MKTLDEYLVWSKDFTDCPTGSFTEVLNNLNHVTVLHVPEYIWAAGECGVMTRSRWLPDEGRFECFTAEVPPKYWQPYYKPTHPEETIH